MKQQRMAILGGLLAAIVAVMVTGVAARSGDDALTGAPQSNAGRTDRQDRRERTVVGSGDRRVIRLDGRGSQLGVMVSDTDDATRPGVRIDGVDDGSAAAQAGAKEGDVVVEFDGERVRSARQLTRLVQETASGRTVKMTVMRDGNRQTLDVVAQARETDWSARLGPEIRDEIERSLEGLRDLPRIMPPSFDFRFDGGSSFGSRGRLGIQAESLGDQLADYFGATNGGVLVSSVTKESPAEKAGLRAGDVITSVNGAAVKDRGDLVHELAEMKDGAAVSLGIVRDKKASTLTATIEPPRRTPARRSTRPA